MINQDNALASCRYLRACIDEAMRLSPAAPGSFWRSNVSSDVLVSGVRIPSGYEVGVGIYALHHNSDHFPDAWNFRPERFLESHGELGNGDESRPTSLSAGAAFAPFLLGPRACPARSLAYLQISLLIAHVIWRMDFQSAGAEGQGRPELGWGRDKEDEFQLWDVFSANKEGPMLRFRQRSAISCRRD